MIVSKITARVICPFCVSSGLSVQDNTSGLWKTLVIFTGHMNPQSIAADAESTAAVVIPKLYLGKPLYKHHMIPISMLSH